MSGSDQDFETSGATSVELAEEPFPSLASSRSEAEKKSRKAISVAEQLAIILAKQVQHQQLFDKVRGLRDRFTPPTTKATDPDRVLRDKTALLLDYKFKLELQETEVDILQTLRYFCRLARLVTVPIYLPDNECETWLLGEGPDSIRAHVQAEEHDPEFVEYLRTQIDNQTAEAIMESYEFRTMRKNYVQVRQRPECFPAKAKDSATRSPGAVHVPHPKKDAWHVCQRAERALRDKAFELSDKTKSKGEGSKSGGTTYGVTSPTPAGKESK